MINVNIEIMTMKDLFVVLIFLVYMHINYYNINKP